MAKALLLLLSLAPLASLSAKDAIQAAVTPTSVPTPIVINNGNPYSSGTFALGTIQLLYTVNAFRFTAGTFATFRVDLQDVRMGSNANAKYPVDLNLAQIGSTNLILTPSPTTFSVGGIPWANSSTVTISIPASTVADDSLNLDGTDLVGNLQLAVSPQGSQVDTVTNVQVHIRLVHPAACLRVYDFVTDETLSTIVTYTDVNVNANKGTVTSTNPFGSFSGNILIVNACSPRTFDLKINLDPSFQTSPNGNPGNAVFTYLKAGYVDPVSFNITAFGTGTPRGQQLCLSNVTVPTGDSFLAAVHMGVNKGMPASELPTDGTFDFSAELRAAGTGCAGALELATPVTPISFTMK